MAGSYWLKPISKLATGWGFIFAPASAKTNYRHQGNTSSVKALNGTKLYR